MTKLTLLSALTIIVIAVPCTYVNSAPTSTCQNEPKCNPQDACCTYDCNIILTVPEQICDTTTRATCDGVSSQCTITESKSNSTIVISRSSFMILIVIGATLEIIGLLILCSCFIGLCYLCFLLTKEKPTQVSLKDPVQVAPLTLEADQNVTPQHSV